MKREPFVTGEYYHLLNRGVEKRNIYMDDVDRKRFLMYLTACNSDNPLINFSFKLKQGDSPIEVSPHYRGETSIGLTPPGEQLVHIISYCLMPNHFHLLVRQNKDGGIPKFMQKIGTGYTMFFNKRYERIGSLFQGVFKSVHISTNRHLQWLPHYIHANPLDLSSPEWRDKKIKDIGKTILSLKNYQWSSYQYFAELRSDKIIQEDLVKDLFGTAISVDRKMVAWLHDLASTVLKRDNTLQDFSTIILE